MRASPSGQQSLIGLSGKPIAWHVSRYYSSSRSTTSEKSNIRSKELTFNTDLTCIICHLRKQYLAVLSFEFVIFLFLVLYSFRRSITASIIYVTVRNCRTKIFRRLKYKISINDHILEHFLKTCLLSSTFGLL